MNEDNIKQRIEDEYIEDKLKVAYLDYAMSVIIGRALPDVRDGLKPVHRRILFAMKDLGITNDKPYKKSARIVGEVIGKYHPHGDSAIYDTLVRLVQEFTMRVPLIQGQGNFGSIDGDEAAAMRYTEARLHRVSELLTDDLDKDTVDFTPNFDDSLKEPVVFPAAFPNLLVNGSSGIAVGMATNIPPHNMTEVINGICYAIEQKIDEKDYTVNSLQNIIKGPDFPTGAILLGVDGINDAYSKGRGKIRMRAVCRTETTKKDKKIIVITELPYQVNKAKLIVSIADLVKNQKIDGIDDINDESDKDGMRIVIVLKKGTTPEIILNYLYKNTNMETTYGINMLALVKNQPKVLNLKEILEQYIIHRKEIVIRRTKYELIKAEKRVHILDGYIIALDNIQDVIKLLQSAKDADVARNKLMEVYCLTKIQSQAILDMRLQRLTGLEREKINNEYDELVKKIQELKSILDSITRSIM